MKRRIVSVLMALVMALSLLPVQALAEDAAVGEPEEPVREFVQGEAQLTVSTAAMAAGTAAAEVGTAADLTAALADSTNGVVRLTADITITAGLKIQHNVTVNLNGHILRYDETADPDSIFRVAGGKTLTLTDSRPAATHEDAKLPAGGLITGGKGYRHDGGHGGYHIYYYYGGGVYVETGASFELAGGTIYACGIRDGAISAYGGGIYCVGGSVTMSGGVISGCSANTGGGILTSRCTVQITGGRIENCKAIKRGGGLSVSGHTNGPVSVLDTVISGCEAENGGGVALIDFAELELGENARITGCTATEKNNTKAGNVEYGAAIYMDLDSLYLRRSDSGKERKAQREAYEHRH